MTRTYVTLTYITLLGVLAGCGAASEDEVEEVHHMHDTAFHTAGDQDPYIGTHYGLLHVNLEDETLTWQGTEEDRHDYMGFTILDDGTFISSGHPGMNSDLDNPLGVMRSDDEGDNWDVDILYPEVDFHNIVAKPDHSEVIYGFDAYNGDMYRSTDAGYEWEDVNTTEFEGEDLLELLVDHDDENTLAAASQDGVHHSTDGGETWELTQPGLGILSAAPYDDGHLVYGVGEDAGWLFTEDLGRSLEPLDMALPAEPVITLDTHEDMIAAGGAEDSFFLSFDQGETWETWIDEGTPNTP
ncbi:BNR/Asp-box repeat protein [Salsuginibacillus halophilus]|uniref:BNR/Asp-box repeat protein n=1 Tax=Salsuginibacillus halophilus TaxID=517424 RepID=A0A2P8H8Q9_9BACI|nr:hypothetical protein [Salsuginibacillus halophilus]PSL42570.1 BNR/Asp-box repeat protein [Salsuginibacillus halophilus]